MQIIGFSLSKVLVEKQEKQAGKIEIKQNINIDDISKDKITISGNDILKINFTFNIDYSPDFAKIEFKGQVVLLPEKEELKNILKEWKKNQISEKTRAPLFNFIMGKCNIKALTLEDEMSLPLHVPMPRLTPNQDKN